MVLQSACCYLSIDVDSKLVGENMLTEQSCVVSDNVASACSYSIAYSALMSAELGAGFILSQGRVQQLRGERL